MPEENTLPLPRNRRRPRTIRSEKDERIIRGAELLRAQLISEQQQQTAGSSPSVPNDPIVWKSHDSIQDDSARIRADLMRFQVQAHALSPGRKAMSSSGAVPAPSSNKISKKSQFLKDEDCRFEEVWESPNNHLSQAVLRERVKDGNGSTITFASRASQWADRVMDCSGTDRKGGGIAAQDSDGQSSSHVSYMGRDGKLKTKKVTYLVEHVDYTDDDEITYDFVENDYDNGDIDISLNSYRDDTIQEGKLLTRSQTPAPPMYPLCCSDEDFDEENLARPITPLRMSNKLEGTNKASPTSTVDLSFSPDYDSLLRDPAYLHAQEAGFLWQSLVGQHVRFPRHWWNGARGPSMGADRFVSWQYLYRMSVPRHKILQKLVNNRASSGRLLLHMIVQDFMTHRPVQDIIIGCFHPNARGVRSTEQPDKSKELDRDIWMAVRKVNDSVLDSLWVGLIHKTPLGSGTVDNTNVRVVFGDQPPLETIFIAENELYERLSNTLRKCPALQLLEEFVFS